MNCRILVVDDNRTTRDYLDGLLRDSFEIALAASGEEALALAAEQMPTVVLLDIIMPGIDGCETCRRLKAMYPRENIQAIMVTASSSHGEQLRAYEHGADAYIVKPIDPYMLMSEIRLHLRLRQAIGEVKANQRALQSHQEEIERLVADRRRQVVVGQDLAVFALAKVAESRDDDTGEHLTRVRSYAQTLGEQLRRQGPYAEEITDAFLADLYRSSPLHDIGKVGVSDAILLKRGPLTSEEFELMKMHTVLGANTLNEIVSYSHCGGSLAMGVDIARWHHERFDGTGYPDHLAGQAIPLAARIVALADVFDALTSVRPYKPAYSPTYARRIVWRESGKHFDPEIVEAFEARLPDILAIQEQAAARAREVPAAGKTTGSEDAWSGLVLPLP